MREPSIRSKRPNPSRYGDTYRLELNKELYEGVRYGWIHVASVETPPLRSTKCGSSARSNRPTTKVVSPANDPELTRIWYTGAYTVKMNLLKDYFGAILMERSDRALMDRRRTPPRRPHRWSPSETSISSRKTVLYLDPVQRHCELFASTGCSV